MSDGWNIALLGATGAVGNAVLELLAQRQFPVGELYLLASDNGAGEIKRFEGRSVRVEDAAGFDWSQAQLAFLLPVAMHQNAMPKRRRARAVW